MTSALSMIIPVSLRVRSAVSVVRAQAGRRVGGTEGGCAERRVDLGIRLRRLSACRDLGKHNRLQVQ
jgi:hypothetical protein